MANFTSIREAFSGAHIFTARKANPAPPILQRLAAMGCGFDAASYEEISLCRAAGAPPDRISFGNTIKKTASIARAHADGIGLSVFDCAAEPHKIAREAPGARVFCRIAVATSGAVFPLARKFGTSVEQAAEWLLEARKLGLKPYGVSFQVGSQQRQADAHQAAIGQASMVFKLCAHAGLKLGPVNLGGGFPTRYQENVQDIAGFADGIDPALSPHFGSSRPDIFVEPGRYRVGDAAVVLTEIVLVSSRDPSDPCRWVYLDIGRYGGPSETEDEATHYVCQTPYDGTEDGPVMIASPRVWGLVVRMHASREAPAGEPPNNPGGEARAY